MQERIGSPRRLIVITRALVTNWAVIQALIDQPIIQVGWQLTPGAGVP